MKKYNGFTLIELVMFIIITAIIASGILFSIINSLQNTPFVTKNNIAIFTARQCADWFLGQRYLNGYNSINCVSTVPNFCTAPTGYTIAVACSPTTINGDSNYKTLTINISGQANTSLNLLIANY